MIASPRVALASGAGAVALAAVMLGGRLDGSVVSVLLLTLAARAAATVGTPDPAAARALQRQIALVPAWVGVVVAASMRAGSTQLGAVRGANAVAGLAIAHGEVAAVLAAWAGLAVATACVVASQAGAPVRASAALPPMRIIGTAAIALQAWLAVTLFAGPQVNEPSDAVPWLVAILGAAWVWWRARAVRLPHWLPVAAGAASATSVALAFVAGAV